MRIPKTRLGKVDIGFLVLGGLLFYVIGYWMDVQIDSALLPTVVNGISTVTGIMISLSSVLIVFSLNLLQGKFLKQYRDHMIISTLGLAVPAVALVLAYSQLISGSLLPAVRWAALGLAWALIVLFEYLTFFHTRIIPDRIERPERMNDTRIAHQVSTFTGTQ